VSKIFYRQDKGVAVANSSQPTQTTQNQQQNNTSEHGLPSLDDIINGNIPENSSTSPTTPSTNTAIDRTLGRWNFTLNNIQGQIQMYESGGKTYNQVSYQNGQVITEELYQQGDKIYVRDSEQGEYYTPRSNGNLDAYTRDGHVVSH
jgi:hypothetical protein